METPGIESPEAAQALATDVDALLQALVATPHLDAPLTMDCTFVTMDLDIPLNTSVGQALIAVLRRHLNQLQIQVEEESDRGQRLERRLEAATTSVLDVDSTSRELGEQSVVSTDSLDTATGFAWRNREDLDEGRV